jgi:hypothetical protein
MNNIIALVTEWPQNARIEDKLHLAVLRLMQLELSTEELLQVTLELQRRSAEKAHTWTTTPSTSLPAPSGR